MQVKKQQLELDMEQWTGSELEKEYNKAVYYHSAYLTYMQGTSCKMLGWMNHKLESRLPRERSTMSVMQMIPLSWQKVKRIKEPLDEGERGEWKSWFKTQGSKNEDHGIWFHHFIANRRGKSENSDRFYFLGLKNHCGWWLQSWNWKTLAPWKESYDKPRQRIKKQRHHFSNKGWYSQSYIFFQ